MTFCRKFLFAKICLELKVRVLDFKIKMLKEVDRKLKLKKEICADFSISGSTLSTFIKDREKIEKAFYSSTFQPERKRLRTVDDDRQKVEEGLLA